MKSALLLLLSCFSFSLWASQEAKILILGDSLTEGYGVNKEQAYPHQLDQIIKKKHTNKKIVIINGGISGSTSASSEKRLKWYLKSKPTHLVLALGANDGLRGISVEATEKNLSKAIELAQKSSIKVYLAGMKAPPNYGVEYTKKFEQIYLNLKNKYKITLIPFLLNGVAGEPKLNLADGIHPNELGHKKMAHLLYQYLSKDL